MNERHVFPFFVQLYNVKADDLSLSHYTMYKNHLIRISGNGINKQTTDNGVKLGWRVYYSTRCANTLKVCNEIELIMDNLTVRDDKVTRVDNYIDVDDCEKGILLSLLRPEYNLYDYQIRDIMWMRQKEQSILDTPNDELLFQGGLYANQVGLGKTLVMLMLIKATKTDSTTMDYTTDDTVCNYKYTRGKVKGEYCRKEISDAGVLYCKEHNKRTFHGSRIIEKRMGVVEGINSNATVIFCPKHITSQWLDEVKKFFGASMRAIMYINKSSTDIMTRDEIFGADVIIMPHSLMTCFGEKVTELARGTVFKRIVYDECHEIKIKNGEYYTNIGIDARVVWCVSGTPFSRQENNFTIYLTLLTQHKKDILSECTRAWLDNQGVTFDNQYNIQYDPLNAIAEVMRRNGKPTELDFSRLKENCRRNTKEEVQHELETFRLIDTVKLLEFTKIERNIYESYKRSIHNMIKKELLQMCCDTELIDFANDGIKKCETLEQVSELLLSSNRVKLEHLEKEMRNVNRQLEILESRKQEVIDTLMDTYQIDNTVAQEWYTKQLTTYKQKITELTNKYKCQERMVSYLGDSINRLKKGKEPATDDTEEVECAICLGEYDTDITVLECGHIYCTGCFDMITASVKSCPTCKSQIKNKARYDRAPAEEEEYTGELKELIEKLKSTKMANIVDYIQKLDTKCIVFSQWDVLLHKIGKNLEGHGIKVEYCEGSVYKRTKSIKNFTTSKDTNVFLLSSKNAASGLNLTVADTIILLEPVYGDANYKENIENQAIGRVNRIGQKRDVKIVRFLIKDTVEEDIHNGTVNFKDIQHITAY